MTNSQITHDPVRDDILNGARELFKKFGYRKTTMEDIARQIGKSKSALYYYYKTKEEIFEEAVLQDMELHHNLAIAAAAKQESAQEKFCTFITTILGNVREKTDEYSLFRAEMVEMPVLIEQIALKREKYLESFLKDIIIYGISRGEVRMMSSEQMDVWTRMIQICFLSLGSKLFHDTRFEFMLDHLSFIADSWFSGIAKST